MARSKLQGEAFDVSSRQPAALERRVQARGSWWQGHGSLWQIQSCDGPRAPTSGQSLARRRRWPSRDPRQLHFHGREPLVERIPPVDRALHAGIRHEASGNRREVVVRKFTGGPCGKH